MNKLEFSKKDREVARFIPASYRGRRKVRVIPRTKVYVNNAWDSGSKDSTAAHDFHSGRHISLEQANYEHQSQGNPFNQTIGHITLTPDICAVQHSIFRGKDLGYTIYVHPETFDYISEIFEEYKANV